MANFQVKKKPTISLSLFTTLSESFSLDKSANLAKSLRNFEAGVVGLGIVAAMTDLSDTHDAFVSNNLAVSPRSNPIPIVSKAKPVANFRGWPVDLVKNDVDEYSESYTCVISHVGNNSKKKRVYFDDKCNGTDDCTASVVTTGVFSASTVNVGEAGMEIWTTDFLSSCNLCRKQLHGLDIFIYRGEKAFCSAECRDKHISNDYYKEKCRSGAMKPLGYSMSPCSGPLVSFAGVVAA
ncbi:DUF581 domain-containing protein [Quillaja saponaria]|uniref:DUF581 domain-containing protein n=1 Tax=Quillaja saponaria TaxID=32244 RepID=A0AAD7Q2N9_QUISA|nr:DUF581 domain-containing protein [Quillaja saponaria]